MMQAILKAIADLTVTPYGCCSFQLADLVIWPSDRLSCPLSREDGRGLLVLADVLNDCEAAE